MAGSNGGKKKNQNSGGGGGNNAMVDGLRGACPPHKQKDLAALVRQLNGDEAKIMERIQQWWDEPVQKPDEEEWEDVNKKSVKTQGQKHNNSRGGGRGPGGRSEGGGRGRDGGRGGRGGDKRDKDRPGRGPRGGGGRGSEKRQGPPPSKPDDAATASNAAESVPAAPLPPPTPPGVPAPAANAPALKGAWGARAAAAAPAPAAPPAAAPPTSVAASSSKPVEKPAPPKSEAAPATETPTNGAAKVAPVEKTPAVPKTAVPPGGSVWAIKGSAHLIQAEKAPLPAPAPAPKSAPAAKPPKQPAVPQEQPKQQQATLQEAPAPAPTLESGLPKSVPPPPGVPAPPTWKQPVEPAPAAPIERPPPSPAVSSTIATDLSTSIDQAPSTVPESPSAMKVLNMGHWDSGDTDNIDFGFGSFGAAPITAPSPAAKPQSSLPPVTSQSATTSASPARPPPGLSISGMPPMPASAMTVADLENKLESASLTQAPAAPKPVQPATSVIPTATQGIVHGVSPNPALPSALTQHNYGQYNMTGMYSYNNPGSGFVGMPGPVLTGGVLPPQAPKQEGGAPGLTATSHTGGHLPAGQPPLAQQGLYGSQAASSTNSNVTETSAPAANSVPPGMPGAMPYANPAMHYGQQQFYPMGNHQTGMGYGYGYGQFGNVAQGGFGYQQHMMGQNQGYGNHHGYDDQVHNSGVGGGGGYQNKGGGYRGRSNYNSNSNSNQYGGGHHQNQHQAYGQQGHGGYGGQPAYGMGYQGHGGPSGMGDPYMMQQQQGGFDEPDKSGRKGGGRGSHGFQQGPPPGVGQQQTFGLQGHGGVDSAPSSGGWSGQGGGWNGNQFGN